MKTTQINSYDRPDVITLNPNTPSPTFKEEQILIHNAAARTNPIDGTIRAGYLKETTAKRYIMAISQNNKINTDHLKRLTELVDARKIKVDEDKIFSLEKIQDEFTRQKNFSNKGKVVIKIKK